MQASVRENVYNNSKNVKVMFFWILKNKRKKVGYSFTVTNIKHLAQKCGHRKLQLRAVCDKCL